MNDIVAAPVKMLTFGDLIVDLNELYDSPATRRDYGYAIKKCAHVYGNEIDRLPLQTVGAFQEQFKLNGFKPSMPFKSNGSYQAWRKKVLAALRKHSGISIENGRLENDDEWVKNFREFLWNCSVSNKKIIVSSGIIL